MYRHILGLTASALILAYGTVGVSAQDQMSHQGDHQQMQFHPASQDGGGMMEHGGMMGGGMMGHMMGRGTMGPPFMMRMMFALMDADGDGTISLQEFQAAHERIFKAMDTNRDGKLTPDEMQAFIHGGR
ncbi:EF-hand domain-containing protein [Bradyrhizobium elkanii]